MKKQLLLAALLATGTLYINACKKKDKEPLSVTATTMISAKDFVSKYGAPKQTVSFNTTQLPKTFALTNGSKITIYANSLTVNGIQVTGDMTFEAYEVLKRSDVIFTGTNTNHSSGAPLKSDGFVYVDIKMDGVSIDKSLAVPYRIEIPTKREGEFTSIWIGDTDAGPGNQLAWAPPMNGGNDSIKAVDSIFGFTMRDLGWTNCDVFYANTSPKTTLTVTILNNPGQIASFMGSTGETFVLFCPQGQNVVAQLYTPAGTNTVKSYDNSMPIGATGSLLAFSIKDGKTYMARQDVTISAGMSATLTLAEVSEAALTAEINAMDTY